MDLFENPFAVIGATPRDSRHRILELVEASSLQVDDGPFTDARTTLITPRRRLSAELAWMPGLGPKRTFELLTRLKREPRTIVGISHVNDLARANLLASAILRLPDETSEAELIRLVLELARACENVDSDSVRRLINEDRSVAGFPDVVDVSEVDEGLLERRRHYCARVVAFLNRQPVRQLISIVTAVTVGSVGDDSNPAPALIHDIVDAYEVQVGPFLNAEAENATKLIEAAKEVARRKGSTAVLDRIVGKLEDVLRNWDLVAQPVQLSKRNRGLDDDASIELARKARDLALHLFNEHDLLEQSKRITAILGEVFAEVPRLEETATEDEIALDSISSQRDEMLRRQKSERLEWEKKITYSAEVGAIFKRSLRISADGIVWQGRSWPLNQITWLAWGATKHYVNGIPTGTTYSIKFRSPAGSAEVVTRNESVYRGFNEALWAAVGLRLLTEMLEAMRQGQRVKFGDTWVDDGGIMLARQKFFGRDPASHVPWSAVKVWSENGAFVVASQADERARVSLSYSQEGNVHLLESAVRMSFKKGGARLSSVLDD